MPVEPLLAFVLLASQPAPVLRVDDTAPVSCLSSQEIRDAVAEGKVIQPAEASRNARHAAPGEVLRISLCRQGEEYVYLVTTMKRDGRVARVTLEGQSGKVATVR